MQRQGRKHARAHAHHPNRSQGLRRLMDSFTPSVCEIASTMEARIVRSRSHQPQQQHYACAFLGFLLILDFGSALLTASSLCNRLFGLCVCFLGFLLRFLIASACLTIHLFAIRSAYTRQPRPAVLLLYIEYRTRHQTAHNTCIIFTGLGTERNHIRTFKILSNSAAVHRCQHQPPQRLRHHGPMLWGHPKRAHCVAL